MSSLTVTRYKDVYAAIEPTAFSKAEFAKKVVIVTGGGNGLGRAAGLAFAQIGSHVTFADIIAKDADSAAQEARKFGVPALSVCMDVTSLVDNKRLVKT